MSYPIYTYEKEYDVVVMGGGTSGVAAAIASARTGAKTLLIERTGTLGGQMTLSGPPGFAYARLFNCWEELCHGGIITETYERLLKAGHALPHNHHSYRTQSSYSFSYIDPEWWQLLIFEMMTENHVDLLLHTFVSDVEKDGDKVTGVVVENANGRVTIKCKVAIECTGEGDIAVRAGCDSEIIERENVQPHSLAFTMDGVDWKKLLHYIHENPDQIMTGPASCLKGAKVRDNEETLKYISTMDDPRDYGEILGFFDLKEMAMKKGEWHGHSGIGFFLSPKEGGVLEAHMQHSSQIGGLYTHDAWDLTETEVECRRQVAIAIKFFQKYIPGFENAYLVKLCTECRLREGRRIMGDYYLTTEDIKNGNRHYDVVGLSCMISGGHHADNKDTFSPTVTMPKDGGTWDIPYRILVPQKVENLLIAGKCVSTDRDAYMRYLQQTMVTGQAAGVAAGMCAKEDITPRQMESEENVKRLQEELLKQDVILKTAH